VFEVQLPETVHLIGVGGVLSATPGRVTFWCAVCNDGDREMNAL